MLILVLCQRRTKGKDTFQQEANQITGGFGLERAYRHSYHGVVGFPFCLLVETKLGRRLRRLDIADYQNTGLWIGWKKIWERK